MGGHMQVTLCAADGGMAEQGLDDPQIRPRFQQQRGLGMPQAVWCDAFGHAHPTRHPLEYFARLIWI